MAANEETMDVQDGHGQDVIELELEHATEGLNLGAGLWSDPGHVAAAFAAVSRDTGMHQPFV